MSCSKYLNYILIIITVVFLKSVRTDVSFPTSQCFNEYSQQTNNITQTYLESYKACDDKDNINRQPPQVIDVEGESGILQNLSQETCSNVNACNLINDAHDFFECHSNAAPTYLNNSVVMLMRATSISIELNDEYIEDEKELLRCLLAAKGSYLNDSLEAYQQHINCLNNTKIITNSRK